MRIEIDGKEIDIGVGQNLKIVKQWFSFAKYFYLKTPVVPVFQVPLTQRNQAALQANTTTGSNEKTNKSISIYFWQSVRVFRGSCYISATSNSYEIQAYSGENTLKDLFNDELINSIAGYTAAQLTYDEALINGSVDYNSDDIKMMYFDVGRHPNDVDDQINYDDFFLWFNTKYVIEQVFLGTNVEYSVNWNFDTTELEKDYTASRFPMRHSWARPTILQKPTGVESSSGWSSLDGPAVGKFWGPDPGDVNFTEPAFETMKLHDFDTFEFEKVGDTVSDFHYYEIKAKTKFRIDVDITGNYTGGDGFLYNAYFILAVKPPNDSEGNERDPEIIQILDAQVAGSDLYYFDLDTYEFEVDFGYKLFYYIVFDDTAQVGDLEIDTFDVVINPNEVNTGSPITYGEEFLDINTLPNIKKVDFIRDVLNQYSLFMVLDSDHKEVNFYSFNSAASWAATSLDLSNYIDINSIQINTKSPLAQTQKFKYKDGDSLGNTVSVTDDRLASEGPDVIISELYDLTDKRGGFHLKYDGVDLKTDDNIIGSELPYIRGSNNSSIISIPLKLTYPGGTSSDPTAIRSVSFSKYDVSPQSMVENEHETKVEICQNFFELTASFDFPKGFQNSLIPNKTYFINVTSNNKFINGHFLLDRMHFSEQSLTNVRLVKIKTIESPTPPAPSPWQWNDEEDMEWNNNEDIDLNN